MKVKKHTQVIKFVNGDKKTINGIVDITEGDMVKITNDKGVEYMINSKNVLYVIRGVSKLDQKPKQNKEANMYTDDEYEEPISSCHNYS